jgi:pyrroloquinoline quinone (PQQ) biosynthesis protein C
LRISTAVPHPIDPSQTLSDDTIEEAAMIAEQYIRAAYENAATEFIESAEFEALVSGQASSEFVREFLRNVFRTHYLSSHIVALCYASLPSKAAALLRENLLEEMGHSEDEPPHSALLLKLAEGMGFTADEIESLIDDARRRVIVFSATRIPFATLREICLAVLIETLSFEFMLARCSGKIATTLRERYEIPTTALSWFELHSEVDIRHAEEGLAVIQDYIEFHQIADATFELIQRATLSQVFNKHYFPVQERAFALPVKAHRAAKQIESITIYKLGIPFHQTFRHSTQSREESDAVIVRVKDSDGQIGYGEALPRPYVTGGTTASMINHVSERLAPGIFSQAWVPGWDTIDFLSSVHADWTRSGKDGVIAWNATFCAVELALLDWSLRRLSTALADFLPPAANQVTYSGVISSDKPADAAALAAEENKAEIIKEIHDGSIGARWNIPSEIRHELWRRLAKNPVRARQLDDFANRFGMLRPKDYWPQLKFIGCWKGGSVGVRLKEFTRWFAEATPVRDLGYMASEAQITLPISDSGSAAFSTSAPIFTSLSPRARSAMPTLLRWSAARSKSARSIISSSRRPADSIATISTTWFASLVFTIAPRFSNLAAKGATSPTSRAKSST